MKVSLVCRKFKAGGGCERYTLDLVNGFFTQGITPKVYAEGFDHSLAEYPKINAKLAPLSLIPRKIRLPFLSRFVEKQREPDEIVITMTHTTSDLLICGGHHRGYLNAINQKPNLLDRLRIHNEIKQFHATKRIIAHSQLMKEELMAIYDLPAEKITVIYPPVDHQKFTPTSEQERQRIRQSLGFKDDEILYLFPSTGHKRKGFEQLKRYFNQSDLPIKLVVAGTPVKSSKNVVSLGFRTDMPALYQMADYTIMASQYEPFGLVGVESILSGTPVVFAKNMACVEVFQQDFGFTFDRQDPDDLHRAIENAIQRVHLQNGRIKSPLACLRYSPTLDAHIQALLAEIHQLSPAK